MPDREFRTKRDDLYKIQPVNTYLDFVLSCRKYIAKRLLFVNNRMI